MAKFRIFFNGTQVDIDAEKHGTYGDKGEAQIQFYDKTGHTVASFKLASLHGFVKIDALMDQKSASES